MSAALRTTVGVCAAGLSYLLVVGYAQAQQQVTEQIKPAQYGDQDTGRPLKEQRTNGQQNDRGQRNTTYFRGPDAAGSNAAGASASANVDQYLAKCLAINNQAEIELNQFAQERAKNDDVKQFAGQMITDHKQLAEKLARVAGSENSSNRDPALNRLLDINRQITDKCGQMTRAKLEDASGAEFDKCFVGAQVGGHMHMLAALEVISNQANGELKQIAEDARPTVEKHLKHAEQLMKDLDSGNDSRRQARN